MIDLTGSTLVRGLASSTLEDALATREITLEDVFVKARAHDVEAVHAILEADFDVDTQDENGNTLLHVAAQQVDIELCKLLVERCVVGCSFACCCCAWVYRARAPACVGSVFLQRDACVCLRDDFQGACSTV